MSNQVLAVISNYKRPQNVGPIVEQLLADGGCDVVIADNSPDGSSDQCLLPWDKLFDVWKWRVNSGPPARWWPALAWTHAYRYVMLVDDDHLLVPNLAKSLVAQAERMGDKFAVMGRVGRCFRHRHGRWQYRRRNHQRGPVDMAGAGYFLVAERLLSAVRFRDELAKAGALPQMLFHDDILLNMSIQRDYGFQSVMPEGGWASKRMDTRGYAFNATAAYLDVRDDLINLCATLGWKSLL